MVEPFQLGAFRLHAHLGAGASGDVFAGVHPGSGVPVALKVLRGEGVASPRTHEAFREEVRAVARLDHPGVVLVFEHGVVSEAEARAAGGRVTPGAPWLAMEHASRGTLDQLEEQLGWRDVRGIVLALLAALGHAHARGAAHALQAAGREAARGAASEGGAGAGVGRGRGAGAHRGRGSEAQRGAGGGRERGRGRGRGRAGGARALAAVLGAVGALRPPRLWQAG